MLGGHGNSNSMERGLHITRYVEPHVLHYFMIESPQNDTIIECHGVKMVMEDHPLVNLKQKEHALVDQLGNHGGVKDKG